MKIVLVVGSANYVPDWWESNKDLIAKSVVEVNCMNNSIRICKGNAHFWHCSSDLFDLFPHLALCDLPARKVGFDHAGMRSTLPLGYPYSYSVGETTGTTILNTYQHIINYHALFGVGECHVYFIGCDLRYDYIGNSHFYEGGTPDPLRLGADYLIANLKNLDAFGTTIGLHSFNASTDKKSLLPFEKRLLNLDSNFGAEKISYIPQFSVFQIEVVMNILVEVCRSQDGEWSNRSLDFLSETIPSNCAIHRLIKFLSEISKGDINPNMLDKIVDIPGPTVDWMFGTLFGGSRTWIHEISTGVLHLHKFRKSPSDYLNKYDDLRNNFGTNSIPSFFHLAFTGLPAEGRTAV